VAADKGFMAKKNGQLFKNLKLSGQVEATGDLSNFLEDLALLIEENFENNRVPLLYPKAIKSYVQK